MAKKKSAFDRVPQRATGVADISMLNAQALQLLQQGQFQAGADVLRQSLTINPQQPEIQYNLGFAHQQSGQWALAIAAFSQAIKLAPQDADAWMARGHVYATQEQFLEAVQDFAKAVKLAPHNADAWNNYGNALLALDREPEALDAYDHALSLRPTLIQALFNKGKALAALQRYAEAAAVYEAAIVINPDYEEAKWHLSWVKLGLGDFAAGWPLFESRWTVAELGNVRRYPQLPQWLGQEPIVGKSLLLYHEQGLGDTLQFSRYIPLLQAMGAKVSMAVQGTLVDLLSQQWPGVMVAESFADVSGVDLATPLMSLPLALKTTLETVPNAVPYIRISAPVEPHNTERPQVGLVWSGSTLHKNDKNRSVPLETLSPLLALPFDWVCLQPEIRDADLTWLSSNPAVSMVRPALHDFVATAQLIDRLDLVITVDTSVAHLAGAMGKPVWILLPTGCDYRWLLEREDSPWYPTARLFRQTARGDWAGVVSRVVEALKMFAAPRTGTSK
ncbi:MAG: tetratricopeptide repeat protein [Fluviibacter sp.]